MNPSPFFGAWGVFIFKPSCCPSCKNINSLGPPPPSHSHWQPQDTFHTDVIVVSFGSIKHEILPLQLINKKSAAVQCSYLGCQVRAEVRCSVNSAYDWPFLEHWPPQIPCTATATPHPNPTEHQQGAGRPWKPSTLQKHGRPPKPPPNHARTTRAIRPCINLWSPCLTKCKLASKPKGESLDTKTP